MEGFPPTPLVPTGWVNATTPYFFTQPQVTHILSSPTSVYVATNGSDAADNVGSITSPFLTIQAAIDYITNQPPYLAYPQTTVCIFVAPGEYPGNIQLGDNIYIVGATPANNSQVSSKLGPVTIVSGYLTIINNESSDSICRIDNIAFSGSLGVRITPAFYTSSLELSNCTFVTSTALSALAFDQLTLSAAAYVTAKNCTFKSTSPLTNAVISSAVSDLSFLTLEECTIISPSVNGSLINMLGSLTLRDCVLRNIASNQASLGPLIKVVSGANQTPQVDITGCVLEYNDVSTVDASGTKLAVLFDAPLNPIISRITNNTISIFLGAAQTDIVKNIGAGQVTLSQSANSCLLDGKTIDTTNLVLTTAFFLQDSPLPPPPAGGVSYLNSLEGSITLSGGDGITVGSVGNTITVTNTGALSVEGVTGAITLTGTNVSIGVVNNNIDLGVTFPAIPVTSVGAKTGDVTFAAGAEGGLALAYGMNNADPITISNSGVVTIESITGNVTLSTTTTGLTIVPTGQDIAIDVTFPVTSVGNKGGDVTFAADAGIGIAYGLDPGDPISISNTGVLSVSAGTGILTETTAGATTVSAIARPYTLLGATTGGVVTNVIGTGSGNNFTQATFELVSTIQINVPPGWSGGQSVMFDGFAYYNFSSTVNSFWAIYYVTSINPTEESLIGTKVVGNSIAAPGAVSQIYLPMNLTIPPDHLEDAGTITLRVYGYVTTSGEHLSSDPLIDGRVGIVYP
jgi:hypothetical protein